MKGEEQKFQFSPKLSNFLIGLVALIAILYIGKSIIVPILFAAIIAIMLNPVMNFFIHLRIKRILAISITLIIAFLIIAALGILIISRATRFGESWPILVNKFTSLLHQVITDASGYFDINPLKIHSWISRIQTNLITISSAAIEKTIVIIGSGLMMLVLLPIYIFLILYYKPILIEFIYRFFGINKKNQVTEIVKQTKTVIQQYLFGRLIEALIVATLYSVTLLVIGIEYALILGIIGAMVNVIPYIGGMVGVALPVMVALVTKPTPIYAIWVLIVYYIIVLIDNHYIVPVIVASKVKLNALFSILVVLAGNALWGIPGMFLSIPILAIAKVICDNIESLKPWGFLIGDSMSTLIESKNDLKKENDNSAIKKVK
jgi:predicted PurR-regulated permease PerM